MIFRKRKNILSKLHNRRTGRRVLSLGMSVAIAFATFFSTFSMCGIKAEAETPYDAFPYSYRQKLMELNQLHPNWSFVPMKTGLNWDTVVDAEMYGLNSLVYYNVKDSWKNPDDYIPSTGDYVRRDNGKWIRASREAVEYHLNPVNYFDEYHIFAFEQLSYNPSIHNEEGVEGIIANSWMSHRIVEDDNFTYAKVFMQNAMDSHVSPYHLASRVLQEQGRGDINNKTNKNPLISGEFGVYNYYNIGASGKTNDEVIASGVERARREGWTTRFKSLQGGAAFIGKNYINRGQDTLYLQKFDVDSSDNSLYIHQYMQNLQAPMSESGPVYRAYQGCGALEQNFVFKIPIYENMPGSEPPVSLEKVNQFVTRMYNLCLDRSPDSEGLEYWSNPMAERKLTGSQAAYGFVFSPEFKNKNYCNSCYVKKLYQVFLDREYDEAGLKYWVDILNSGQTREAVFNGFVLSPEFTAICEDYGIERGDGITVPAVGTVPNGPCAGGERTEGVSEFVIRLYRVCLDREPDDEGLNYHCNLLWNHMLTCSEDAHGFVFSEEFAAKTVENEVFLEYLYRAFMGRESDPEGMAYWTEKLDNGVSREEIFRGFANSPEFAEICRQYGLMP